MLAQALRDEAGAAKLQFRHGIEVLEYALERVEVLQQRGRRLAPDTRHARHVVDRIAHQRQEVRHALRDHAEALLDVPIAIADVRHCIPVDVDRRHELRQVLVAAHDRHRLSFAAREVRQRADDVVGLVARAAVLRDAERAHDLAAKSELTLQLGRRRIAVRLVLGVDLVAVRLLETLVEGHGDVPGRLALEQVAEEARESMHGIDRVAVAVGDVDRHRVIGAEDEYAGVDKVEHGRHSERVTVPLPLHQDRPA